MSETTIDFENNNCFVCGPSNPIGLRIKFRIDGDVCRGEFRPGENHHEKRQICRLFHCRSKFQILPDEKFHEDPAVCTNPFAYLQNEGKTNQKWSSVIADF